ncbi:MAG: ferrous iron transport protein B [Saprospiraceae bacterium]|nr:ferrous iron transport protein B [Saprospiraceae bacterium]
MESAPIIGLLGNPNAGKSSLFNHLTGLTQKVGNFPGVTVDIKVGHLKVGEEKVQIIDFPGIYSLFPSSQEEKMVVSTLLNPDAPKRPDRIIYVIDSNQINKHFLLLSQLLELDIPILVVLNMMDIARDNGLEIKAKELEAFLNLPVVEVSSRTMEGYGLLKEGIQKLLNVETGSPVRFYKFNEAEKIVADQVSKKLEIKNLYQAKLIAHHHDWLGFISKEEHQFINELCRINSFNNLNLQINETMRRYDDFSIKLSRYVVDKSSKGQNITDKIDRLTTNPVIGPLIFFGILFFIFQAIFEWSSFPMDMIDHGFNDSGERLKEILPQSWVTEMLIDGLWTGLGGILVFVPQIALLFFLITILEETGYMARAVYMFDRIMQKFGMNGRSIVALISGGACAIPAIMSTRTILNWRERLITIFVTPLISCSARIPVYTVLIGLCIPDKLILGYFNLKGLVFFSIYIVGIVVTLLAAFFMKMILKSSERSFLMIEMPEYKWPSWKNILLNVYEKVRSYVFEAGKVIIVIALLLWFLASYGPKSKMADGYALAQKEAAEKQLNPIETNALANAYKIENSYAGILGKAFEPVIKPLGYDWKIGIALICSFAAREVFVGTMATIYSIEDTEDSQTLLARMQNAVDPKSGRKIYTLATCLSLITFYTFALQCMSTLAVTHRETRSWKWPILQFTIFGLLAYISSFIVFQIFS